MPVAMFDEAHLIDLKPPHLGVAEDAFQGNHQNDISPNNSYDKRSLSKSTSSSKASCGCKEEEETRIESDAALDLMEKGHSGEDNQSRSRSGSIDDRQMVPDRKPRKKKFQRKLHSLRNSSSFHDSLAMMSREEVKEALLASNEVSPLKLKKSKSTRHVRRWGSGSYDFQRHSSDQQVTRNSVNQGCMDSFGSQRSENHWIRKNGIGSLDESFRSQSQRSKKYQMRKSGSNDTQYYFSYGSMDSFGSQRSDGSSLRNHPGIGPDEFDPRKEFAYYASHYVPSPVDSSRRQRNVSFHSETNADIHELSSSNNFDSSNHSAPMIMFDSAGNNSSTKRNRKYFSERRRQRMFEEQVKIESVKGEDQPIAFRDIFFALVFVIQFGVIVWSGFKYGPRAMVKNHLNDNRDEETNEDVWMNYHFIIRFAALCGLFASFLAFAALSLLMSMAENVIKYSLVTSIGIAFVWGTIGVGLSPQSLVPMSGMVSLALFIGYSLMVWDRIPFATNNLFTALKGVHANKGLLGITYGLLALSYWWCMWFAFVFLGLYDHIIETRGAIDSTGLSILIALCISSYWIYQVAKHIVVVTVAGTLNYWWINPDHSDSDKFFSIFMINSFKESITHSFGSICLGSLFVGVVGILKQVIELFRPRDQPTTLLCFQECLFTLQKLTVSCVDGLYEKFNQWAFIYVGMHGYSFLDAGKQANLLFEARGWTTIVNDDLYTYVLTIVTIVIGGCTGIFGLLLEHYSEYGLGITSYHKPGVAGFAIGFTMGLLLSNIVVAIVSSALNTMFCCYASRPIEFHKNHTDLSSNLRQKWKESWPDSIV